MILQTTHSISLKSETDLSEITFTLVVLQSCHSFAPIKLTWLLLLKMTFLFVCVCVCLGTQGYVYSSFLKAYNPQREVTERPDDFDNLSLFVSGSRSSSMRSFSPNSTSDSMSPQSGPQDEPDHSEDQYVRHMENACVCGTQDLKDI